MNQCEWPPLESDPEIFNDYFHSIGLPKSVFFKELISISDYKEFLKVEGPILGIVLNFQSEKPRKMIEANYCPPEFVPFFIEQTPELDNACGLIAAIHAFGNNNVKYEPKSILEEFFTKAVPVDWKARATILEKSEKFKIAHKEFAEEGQTKLTGDIVEGHYICFINYQDCIYELDGTHQGPYMVKKDVKSENFIDETGKEILRRVNEKEISQSISVMIVADDKSKVVDLMSG